MKRRVLVITKGNVEPTEALNEEIQKFVKGQKTPHKPLYHEMSFVNLGKPSVTPAEQNRILNYLAGKRIHRKVIFCGLSRDEILAVIQHSEVKKQLDIQMEVVSDVSGKFEPLKL